MGFPEDVVVLHIDSFTCLLVKRQSRLEYCNVTVDHIHGYSNITIHVSIIVHR